MSATSQLPVEASEYFGEKPRRSKYGHKMTREMYAYPSRSPHQRPNRELLGEQRWARSAWAYRDEEHTRHSDLYLLAQRDAALMTFDISMRYFESLDATDFESALTNVLAEAPTLKSAESLQKWDGVPGVYVMVFDEYKQFHVGQASDIHKRIKQHWNGRKGFDRLIYPSKYRTILPVDELRVLDTTRIYAARSNSRYELEQRAENAADPSYTLNRIGGGEATPLMLLLSAASPRSRANGLETVPMTLAEHEQARAEVSDIVSRADATLVAELSNLDMTIHLVVRQDGKSVPWSRRDAISSAAVRGKLSMEDYRAFLEAMGETIIWPEG